jgi:hypothetical protein
VTDENAGGRREDDRRVEVRRGAFRDAGRGCRGNESRIIAHSVGNGGNAGDDRECEK